MNEKLLILLAFGALLLSYLKNKKRTKDTVSQAFGMGKGMILEIVSILALLGLIMAWLPPEVIQKVLGSGNSILSAINGALIGTITLIPAFIAFPLAKDLLNSGANLSAIAAFITTLTMVGVVTLPLEIRYFGKKFSYVRNGLSFILALVIALGVVILV